MLADLLWIVSMLSSCFGQVLWRRSGSSALWEGATDRAVYTCVFLSPLWASARSCDSEVLAFQQLNEVCNVQRRLCAVAVVCKPLCVCAILGFTTRPSFTSRLLNKSAKKTLPSLAPSVYPTFIFLFSPLLHAFFFWVVCFVFFLSVLSLIISTISICTHTHISMVNRALVRRFHARVRAAGVNECTYLRWEALTLLLKPPWELHLSLFQNGNCCYTYYKFYLKRHNKQRC